ncbi:MAG: dihydrofolate reductase [Bacteroidales bacterium]
MLSLIVAVAKNNAIGRKNELLWHISQDLKYFKATTTGHPVIMGRKTYESVGRPLPGRRNIVVTRGSEVTGAIKNKEVTTLETINSLDRVIDIARGKEEFFVMGGGQLYKQTFAKADRLYVTKIYAEATDADTFFPEIKEEEWRVINSSEIHTDEENGVNFQFIVYEKIK